MYDSVTGDDQVDALREPPGSIAQLINRGDSACHIDAAWLSAPCSGSRELRTRG